jgi:tRNA 5-methylaminomethyl-2-thiouridine biosynthesis bifunctional protein
VRGQISIVEASNESNQLKTIICSDGYLSPANNNKHCLGATFSVDNLESALDEEDHQANLFKLKSFSLALHENLKNNIKAGRVSFRCTSFDYFPLVGALLDHTKLKANPPRLNAKAESLPWVNGLYMNIAHGSRGFTSAPFCAELLAQTICQETITMNIELAALMNPNRFALRKLGLKRLAKMTT